MQNVFSLYLVYYCIYLSCCPQFRLEDETPLHSVAYLDRIFLYFLCPAQATLFCFFFAFVFISCTPYYKGYLCTCELQLINKCFLHHRSLKYKAIIIDCDDDHDEGGGDNCHDGN